MPSDLLGVNEWQEFRLYIANRSRNESFTVVCAPYSPAVTLLEMYRASHPAIQPWQARRTHAGARCRQQRPVDLGEPHPVRTELPLKDRELVAQCEDLCVFVPAAHRQQPQEREHIRYTEVSQSQQHG